MARPARFVHVGIHCKGRVPVAELEKTFSRALDWIRYDPHCWILYTSTELNIWRDRLRKVPELSAGEFLLCEIDEKTCTGWMVRDTWDWLQKDR
jgi:hypothetical protein